MDGDKIIDIKESDFKGHNFKYDACLSVINKYSDTDKKIYGIGSFAR